MNKKRMLTLAGLLCENYDDELKLKQLIHKHINSREPLPVNVGLRNHENTLTYDEKTGKWYEDTQGESFDTTELPDLLWFGVNGQLLFDF